MFKSVLCIFVTINLAASANLNATNNTGQCRLPKHPSVNYYCLVGDSSQRECDDLEPEGAVVKPECRRPIYYSTSILPFMRCLSGKWDYVATCTPECGTVLPQGTQLKRSVDNARRGEIPWHVGIYTKKTKPYMQICGGSLVTTTAVISAANCFWDPVSDAVHQASNYAVAAGKVHRPWDHINENEQAQKSDVREIYIPPRYRGAATNYQDDISVVTLATPFQYNTFVRPICLDFDYNFETRQLQPGNIGRIASWQLSDSQSLASQSPALKLLDLPYVDIVRCITEVPVSFRQYIASDKICAYSNDPSQKLCRGGSGSGLGFPETEKGVTRYYLRGVASTGAIDPEEHSYCSQYVGFTQILKHEHFIKNKITW